jgi:ABC-type nickel/cobalt efflux system permease component RcnA
LTISLFALAAMLLRNSLFRLLEGWSGLWHRASHLFEILSALAMIASGVYLMTAR